MSGNSPSVGPTILRPTYSNRQIAAAVLTVALSATAAAGAYFLLAHDLPKMLSGRIAPRSGAGPAALISLAIGSGLIFATRRREGYLEELFEDENEALFAKVFPATHEGKLFAGSFYLGSKYEAMVFKGQTFSEEPIEGLPEELKIPKAYLVDNDRMIGYAVVEDPESGQLKPFDQLWTEDVIPQERKERAATAQVGAFRKLIDDNGKISELLAFLSQCMTTSAAPQFALQQHYRLREMKMPFNVAEEAMRTAISGDDTLSERQQKFLAVDGRITKVRRNARGDHFEVQEQLLYPFKEAESDSIGYHLLTVTYDIGRGEGRASWSGWSEDPNLFDVSGLNF